MQSNADRSVAKIESNNALGPCSTGRFDATSSGRDAGAKGREAPHPVLAQQAEGRKQDA